MVSDGTKAFLRAMGFTNDSGKTTPSVSASQKSGANIPRVCAAGFDPDDDFCPTCGCSISCPKARTAARAIQVRLIGARKVYAQFCAPLLYA